MKISHAWVGTIIWLAWVWTAQAAVFFVDVNNPNPALPYATWDTAATDIQSAIDTASDGDMIWVNDGVYQTGGRVVYGSLTNRVAINKAVTVQSVNGPAVTMILGANPNGDSAVRCVYMTNNSALAGFTLTGGATRTNGLQLQERCGGGVWCENNAGIVISNCVISGNMAESYGGGAYNGILADSLILSNTLVGKLWEYCYGGGAYQSGLINCTIRGNSIPFQSGIGYGGGLANATATNCIIIFNSCEVFSASGGGSYGGTLSGCAVIGNSCNRLNRYEGYGGGVYKGTLTKCTIAGNYAFLGGGTYLGSESNCINYFNQSPNGYQENYATNAYNGSSSYCCVWPLTGSHGISTNPLLADVFHLCTNSPCLAAGSVVWTTNSTDIDGDAWAKPPSIGCDEPNLTNLIGEINPLIQSSDTAHPSGYPVDFFALTTGKLYGSKWDFGDGTSATNMGIISHAWSAPGDYVVTLTAYNNTYPAGQTATTPIHIYIPTFQYVTLSNIQAVAPYVTWQTAAPTIESALSVAYSNSIITVSNGIYIPVSQNAPDWVATGLVISNNVTLQSLNGPSVTKISANNNYRDVYLGGRSTLTGFLVTKGSGTCGGVYCASTNALIMNCEIGTNTGYGVYSGTLSNCFVARNTSGGTYMSVLNSCVLSNNTGGAIGGWLTNCLIVANSNKFGGGIYGSATTPVIANNCIISSNRANSSGGGAYAETSDNTNFCILNNCLLSSNSAGAGGGAYFAILNNCTVISNTAASFGGGANGGILTNCILIGNQAAQGGAVGSPNYYSSQKGVLFNCTLIGNTASFNSGGAYYASLNNCRIIGNVSSTAGGANNCNLTNCLITANVSHNSGGGASYCQLVNCIISSNLATQTSATVGGGTWNCPDVINCLLVGNIATNGGGDYGSSLFNCTIVNNSAISGGGVYNSHPTNCIIYYNTGGDFYAGSTYYSPAFCCLPQTTNSLGNLTNAPLFADPINGDWHLSASSPCINAGDNFYVVSATDLDGNPRLQGGTVDLGAYEYQTPSSLLSYAWAQQYGLPTDGSADNLDLNGTGWPNWQKSLAGLNPTNPASMLAMQPPAATNSSGGITLTWSSVNSRMYYLQRATDLTVQPAFSMVQTNIAGQAGTTSFTDASATGAGPYYYRVGVQ